MIASSTRVSVLIITYNHEKYISQAIEGVLGQITNFYFEIIIGDDASTDRTNFFCSEYQNKYPDRIRLLSNSTNLGAKANFINTLKKCKGSYVAICEGDDYWDDPNKLQEQFDFMEENPQYVMLGGYAKKIFENEGYQVIHDDRPKVSDFDVDTSFLIKNNPFSTLTVFFRNHLIKEFPHVYFTGRGGDRRLYLLLSTFGLIRYMNKAWGVYRIHQSGISPKPADSFSTRMGILLERILNAKSWNRYFDFRFHRESKQVIRDLEARLFKECVVGFRIDYLVRYFLWLRFRM